MLIDIDKDVIPHHEVDVIPFDKLKKMVSINETYLKEKSTWYVIDSKLQYFKTRSDLRLFSELFFQQFARKVIGLDTLKYSLAFIRKRIDGRLEKNHTLGLISENFQDSNHDYFLASELCDSAISDCKHYGEFSLKNLLIFLRDLLVNEDYKECEKFLIKLFITDAFTMQLDRNHNNFCFQIPSIDKLSHLKRLRTNLIEKHIDDSSSYVKKGTVLEPDKIIGLKPSKVYDNERILGIDHKNMFVNKPGDIWTPIFPYSPELYFGINLSVAKEKLKEVSRKSYNDLDPNLVELYMDYYAESKEYVDVLARDDSYKKIIESFCKSNSPICLTKQQQERILNILKGRQEEFQKILKL